MDAQPLIRWRLRIPLMRYYPRLRAPAHDRSATTSESAIVAGILFLFIFGPGAERGGGGVVRFQNGFTGAGLRWRGLGEWVWDVEVDVEVVVGGIFFVLRSGLGGSGVFWFFCHWSALVTSWRWL